MVLIRDFASLAAIFLSLTAFYVCAVWAAPSTDDEGKDVAGPAVAAVALPSDKDEPERHIKHFPSSSESRIRRSPGPKDWDLPERGRDRRSDDDYDPDIEDRRERRGSQHVVELRGGDHWGDYDSLERGRERRGSLSVNHELRSLADMLQDSSKQRKLNKLKNLREEYGKRSSKYQHTGNDDENPEW